jgi:hypothetical protein
LCKYFAAAVGKTLLNTEYEQESLPPDQFISHQRQQIRLLVGCGVCYVHDVYKKIEKILVK